MKYTIDGFKQEEAIKLGLDLTELLIIRWIVDFNPSMSKKEIDNEEYFWVNYQALLDDMPILNISKDRLYRILKKLVEKGILKHKTVKQGGTFSFYSFGEKYIDLVNGKNTELYGENTEPLR